MAPAAETSVMESDQEKGQVDPDRVGDRAEHVEQSQDHPVRAHRIGVVDDYLVEACLPVQKNGRNASCLFIIVDADSGPHFGKWPSGEVDIGAEDLAPERRRKVFST